VRAAGRRLVGPRAGERAPALSTILVAHPSPDLYGSDRMLLESVEGLRDAGHRVVVTVPSSGPLLAELAKLGAGTAVIDVPVLRKSLLSPAGLVRFAAHTARALPAMIRLLRRERPDAVYVNTVTVPLWFLVARLTGRRVLGHVHEAEEAVPRPVRAALALPLLLASTVVVNSRASGAALDVVPGLRRKVRLLYNGVPGPSAELPPATGGGRLVLVGRLSPRKGTDVAVRALAALPAHVTLDLAGSVFPGYEWYEAELRALVDELGLAGRVRFLGFVPSVWTAHAAGDIVLVPSRVEPFGNTAVEGQLAGRPVVVSDTQGLVEIVEHGKTGLVVPPDDPAALAAALRTLLDDPAYAAELAATGREEARRRFDPARYRAEMADIMGPLIPRR
jgi:glycosyltransferase involved in cell wall biosynthesis